MDCRVQAHDAAHAGAADGGAFPEGDGAVVRIDDRFQDVHDPVHGGFAHGFKLGEVTHGGVGQVFAQPLVTLVTALDAHDDDVLAPAGEEIFQSPAFAVGGIGIGKEVMTVEKVHDGVAGIGVVVTFGQVDVQEAVLALGGIDEVSFDNHSCVSFHEKRARRRPPNKFSIAKRNWICQQGIVQR